MYFLSLASNGAPDAKPSAGRRPSRCTNATESTTSARSSPDYRPTTSRSKSPTTCSPSRESVLTIQGERKSEHEEKQGNVQRTERQYGSFFRTVPLPEGADLEHANAKFENGLLEVSVPVPQQKENRRSIPIQGQAAQREGAQAKAA